MRPAIAGNLATHPQYCRTRPRRCASAPEISPTLNSVALVRVIRRSPRSWGNRECASRARSRRAGRCPLFPHQPGKDQWCAPRAVECSPSKAEPGRASFRRRHRDVAEAFWRCGGPARRDDLAYRSAIAAHQADAAVGQGLKPSARPEPDAGCARIPQHGKCETGKHARR